MHGCRASLLRREGLRRVWPSAIALLATSCSPHDRLLPLQLGHTWTYQVRGKFTRFVEPVTVARRMSVAGAVGYELTGPLGTSRVAWVGDELKADRLNDAQFEPSLPLLAPISDRPLVWHGRMRFLGTESPAAATLVEKTEALTIGTRQYSTTAATLSLQSRGLRIELTSWYSVGVGLLRQIQRTNGLEDFSIELLSGDSSN